MEPIQKGMSGEESFEVINRMINSARSEIQGESFYYLFWGWLVFIASLTHYLLLETGSQYGPFAWILMAVGGIYTAIKSARDNKKRKVKTYIEQFMKYTVIAFLIALTLSLVMMGKLQINCYPVVMIVYGMFLFISGGALQHRPLIFGGLLNFVLAGFAFYTDFSTQLLILAAAVLGGYIIPGYMLKSQENRKPVTA